MLLLKRICDIVLSIIGIIVLIPFIPIIGTLIKLDSKGPVFYLADRVGKNFKIFKMYKFRTMIEAPTEIDKNVCPQFDVRITVFGRFLRRSKINELPQLINILKGDMTFVGPRPESPNLAKLYPEKAKKIFSVKPGLVGPSSILGRNEEECYPPGVNAEKYYIENILPAKLKLDLKYIEKPTFTKDVMYIIMGIKETIFGGFKAKHIYDNLSQICLLMADSVLIVCSYQIAYTAANWSLNNEIILIKPSIELLTILGIRLLCNSYFGMYSSIIRYISYHDILNALKGISCGSILMLSIAGIFGMNNYSNLMAVIDWACLVILSSILRFCLRFYWELSYGKKNMNVKRRVLIYGACDEGHSACRSLISEKYGHFEVVGFVDDTPEKYGKFLNGKKVLGTRHHIKELAKLYKIEEIIYAKNANVKDELTEIIKICRATGLRCRIFSFGNDFHRMDKYIFPTRNVEVSDVLPLQHFEADHLLIRDFITNKIVMVNGSGGALGIELCRKILQHGCKKLIVIDKYESYLNELVAALLDDFSLELIIPILHNTDRANHLDNVFDKYRPSIVIHAGMRKYAPFLEQELADLGEINYMRTFNLAKAAERFQCEHFVMISSLMAAKSGNLIADSLRIAEVSLEHFFSETNTQLIIVRMCDIAENRGGIISILEEQIRNLNTVFLPSPDAEVHLTSKHSATEFILQTLLTAKNDLSKNKIFSCTAYTPVSLIEVIKRLANLYGLKFGYDLRIEYLDQSNRSISTSRQETSFSSTEPLLLTDALTNNLNVSGEEIKAVFKDFVRLYNDSLEYEDWKTRTNELMRFCGQPTT